MASIYKLIIITAVFINFNYAAFDSIAQISSKGGVPYSAIKASNKMSQKTVICKSSANINPKEVVVNVYDRRVSRGVPEFSSSPLIPFQDLHGRALNNVGVMTQSKGSFNSTGAGLPVLRLPSFEDVDWFPIDESAEVEAGRGSIFSSDDESSEAEAFTSLSNSSCEGLGLETTYNCMNNDSSGLNCLTEDFLEMSVTDSDSDSDSDDVLSNACAMPSILNGELPRPFANKNGAIANYELPSIFVLPRSDEKVTAVGDELPSMLSLSRSDEKVTAADDVITVTFTKNNQKITVLRSKPVSNDSLKVDFVIRQNVFIKRTFLTPLNNVMRQNNVTHQETVPKPRADEDLLREAGKNCLLPIRFGRDKNIQLDVAK